MALKLQQSIAALGSNILLAGLLVVSLVLVTLYFREGEEGVLHQVQSSVSGAVIPLKFASGAIGSGTDSASAALDNLSASEATLEALRQQNQELREQIARLEEYRQEANRLEDLLGLKEYYVLDTVPARVTSRTAHAWENTITINRGERHGIIAGLPVMGQSGIIGQVVSVSGASATVRLLQDPQSGVAVLIQSNRAEGIVRGSLDGLLYLENLDVNAGVQVGDVLITSGLGGRYFRGLLVGTVVRVDENQGGETRRIVVLANASARSLEEVLVIVKMDSEGDAPLPSDTPPPEDGNGDEGESGVDGDGA
ncbi:MAG: rod shape-determining protein MreC [Eggerthellaceae bacterium]|jgi:rod shape-determining protein MreC|nr:rod shape-determining protein MreC [Eggerthellaceae bacterium]MDR2715338.1 rod shape-determining protein MreC [Coriobacteriaceae bacterium]